MEGSYISAYTEVETNFTDPALLCAALQDLGYTATVYATAVQLEDYHGHKRPDTAEIVIPRAQVDNAANDIGFKRQANGTYQAIISQYDSGRHGAEWRTSLKVAYAERGTMAKAAKAGLRFLGKKKINGKIRLQFAEVR